MVRRHPCKAALVAAALVASCSGRPEACEVAAASSLRPLLEAMLPGFREQHESDIPVLLVTGATTQLSTQIAHGAPFSLLLTADQQTVDRLVAQQAAPAADRFAFARGELVLWTADDAEGSQGLDGLKALDGPIAIANPEVAPYGRAAMETLRASDLLDSLEPRLVRAENAAQAAHFAATGAADAALLPRSLCMTGPLTERGRIHPVPSHLHQPILHEGLILAKDDAARRVATALRDHLQSAAGLAQLQAYGLGVPQ